ncbi:hypothetical protein [Amycolatopsis suaedae]|uniref:Uncharacterized protein n=1 Tax=Amycolatopsis suaedae TaxID=2510978 RepID=A0A4Q7J3Y9_9PSEU|nr:hypothetical protein [Amycolatopsis suaedae]RZQ62251.1 hypothetical protein EWH70_18385 [Amycolatopsis suaedae]
MTVRITDEYFRYATNQIRLGKRHHMPGIRRCTDCRVFYRQDGTGLTTCPQCRTKHDRICVHCTVRFSCDEYGTRLCKSCRDQTSLF